MYIFILATLFIVLLCFSALFSAVETAFFSIRPEQIHRLHKTSPRFAKRLEAILDNPRRLLSAVLLADTCSNLPLIIVCLVLMGHISEYDIPSLITALLIFAVVVILCDLLPKMVALRAPMKVAFWGSRFITHLLPAFDPFCRILQRASDWAASRIKPSRLPVRTPLGEAELETLIQIGTEEGFFQNNESSIIQEILKLNGKTAHDCMLPRIDVFAIPDDLTNEEAMAQLRAKRYRRVPVYGSSPDDILGILDVKRFLMDPSVHYTEYLTPPSYVPETMKSLDLLRNFLRHPQRLAIVVDEFGGTEGIVTLPDILSHLIPDAHPSADDELYIANFGEGRLIVAGNARLDDLSESLGVDLTFEGIDTIGGLIFNRLGYFPKPGETITLNSLRITVRRASRTRIHELLIERISSPVSL